MTAHRHMDTFPLGSKPGKSDESDSVWGQAPPFLPGSPVVSVSARRQAEGDNPHPRPHGNRPRGRCTQHGGKPRAATGGRCAGCGQRPRGVHYPCGTGKRGPCAWGVNPRPVEATPQGAATRDIPLDPSAGPMETDPDQVQRPRQADPRGGMPPRTSPMELYPTTVEAQEKSISPPGTPRSQHRATASSHPSCMGCGSMSRCARREGAFPFGMSCLQLLFPHLRSFYLSDGSDLPDRWLRAKKTTCFPGLPQTVSGWLQVPVPDGTPRWCWRPLWKGTTPPGANAVPAVQVDLPTRAWIFSSYTAHIFPRCTGYPLRPHQAAPGP